jgi:hypothetical protein
MRDCERPRAPKAGAFETRPGEVGAVEMRLIEDGAVEMCPAEVGAVEMRRPDSGSASHACSRPISAFVC